MLHTHLRLNVNIAIRTSGRSLGTVKERNVMWWGALGIKYPRLNVSFQRDSLSVAVAVVSSHVAEGHTIWWLLLCLVDGSSALLHNACKFLPDYTV